MVGDRRSKYQQMQQIASDAHQQNHLLDSANNLHLCKKNGLQLDPLSHSPRGASLPHSIDNTTTVSSEKPHPIVSQTTRALKQITPIKHENFKIPTPPQM